MPMIKIGKDIKNIKLGDKDISKVYKGDNLIWEKIFKVLNLKVQGSVNFNGDSYRKLPLNLPLKLIVNGSGYGVEVNFDGEEHRPLYRNAVFILKRDAILTISNDYIIDISILQTTEQPTYIFE